MEVTKILYSFIFFLIPLSVFAQKQAPVQAQSNLIELQSADNLVGGMYNGQRVEKLIGNVVFKQNDTFLYADSVYQFRNVNMLEAFGNVRINQADTVSITGNHAIYNGNKRTAKMTGNVVMQDPRMTLTTPSLDYNLENRTAAYTEGGTIVDPENRLRSRRGTYDTRSKLFLFQQDVKVFTADYNITAENLRYNTLSKIVYFQGPTLIKGQSGNLYAEEGTYNTLTKVSRFGKNAYILTPEYRLGGDNLFYDQAKGYGYASKNVTLRSLKDDITIYGQTGRYWRDRGIAKVAGKPIMQSVMDGDTLYMAADTLVSLEPKGKRTKSMLYAYNNVKIFKADLQGSSDSLSFNRTDSVMHLNGNPVLWSNKSQLESDTIHIYLRNRVIDRMEMYSNAFIASEDTLKNYNQIKGRHMTAFFKNGDISKVNVNGNGESIYYVLEGDSVMTGLNKVICSNMVIRFAKNKLKTISFLVKPDAKLIPPHELKPEESKLDGFNWQIKKRPEKKLFLARKAAASGKIVKPVSKPVKVPPAKGNLKKVPIATKKQDNQAKVPQRPVK
jgi:lipopolysaccharide export system protein LptA